ncbi:MAG: hypothetical protein GY750_20865 [Lentisphaerae bacterium]|nr:hypothetical protein [Lentisphaerota bacterium]
MKSHLLKAGHKHLTACGDINGHKSKTTAGTDCKNCQKTKEYRRRK